MPKYVRFGDISPMNFYTYKNGTDWYIGLLPTTGVVVFDSNDITDPYELFCVFSSGVTVNFLTSGLIQIILHFTKDNLHDRLQRFLQKMGNHAFNLAVINLMPYTGFDGYYMCRYGQQVFDNYIKTKYK